MGVGVQVPPRTQFVSYNHGNPLCTRSERDFCICWHRLGIALISSICRTVNGEYPIAALCRGVSPRCSCKASTRRPRKSMTHSAGSRLFQPVSLAGRLLATGRAARVGWACRGCTRRCCRRHIADHERQLHQSPTGAANTFRRNAFGCSLDGRRPATMTSAVSASPAPRTNRCTCPLPPHLRLAQVNLSGPRWRTSVVTCTNHGSMSVQFTVWMYP